MPETHTLQGYTLWHPDSGYEWHNTTIRMPRLAPISRAKGWLIKPVRIEVTAVEEDGLPGETAG